MLVPWRVSSKEKILSLLRFYWFSFFWGGEHPDPKRNILNPSKSWSFGRCIFLLQRGPLVNQIHPTKVSKILHWNTPQLLSNKLEACLDFFLSIRGFTQRWFNFRFVSFFLRKTDLSSSGFINEVVKSVSLEDEISKFWSQYRPIFRDSSCWEGILWLGSNPIYSISKWLPYSVVTLW